MKVRHSFTRRGFVRSVLTLVTALALMATVAPLPAAASESLPVAVATASTSGAGLGQVIQFDGSNSFHQNSSYSIVKYEWDFDFGGDPGSFFTEAAGATVTHTYYIPGVYQIALRVTDDNMPPRTAIATVIVTVSSIDNQPPAAADDAYEADEDVPLDVEAPGVLENDTDADSPTLFALLVSEPSHGSINLRADGSLIYWPPDPDWNGVDSFTYKANDGLADSNIVNVTITIREANDPPVPGDDYKTTAKDTPLTFAATDLLVNDSTGPADESGQTLAVIGLANDETVHGGYVTLSSEGIITYTPPSGFFGTDYFAYIVQDNGTTRAVLDAKTAMGAVSVTITNDPPMANDDGYTIEEDGYLVSEYSVLDNDTADHRSLEAVLVSGTSHGSLDFRSNGNFYYTPEANFHGPDSFTYQAYNGEFYSNIATVTITVTSAADPPVLTVDVQPVDTVAGQIFSPAIKVKALEDDNPVSGLAVTVSVTDGGGMIYGTLTQVTDAEGFATFNDLHFYFTGGKVLRFTEEGFGVRVDSSYFYITPAEASSIAISALPNPVMAGGSVGFWVTVLDEFGNPSSAEFEITVEEGAEATRTEIAYVFPIVGTWTVTATIAGTSISDTVEVTVIPFTSNDPPIAVDSFVTGAEGSNIAFTASDFLFTDPEGDHLTDIEIVSLPGDGTLWYFISPAAEELRISTAAISLLTFIPPAEPSGSPYTTFTFKVKAGGAWSAEAATMTINVIPVNDAPSFTKGADQVVEKNAGAQTVAGWATNIHAGPADEGDQELDFILTSDNEALFSVLPAIAPDGVLTYTPAAGVVGASTVTVQLHDSGGTENDGEDTSAPQTFTITVNDTSPVLGLEIEKLVIDFSRQDDRDSINLKASFSLPEDVTFDPETDVVTFDIDGISLEIPAGSFKGNKKEFKYSYDSPKGVEPKVSVTLNFKNGEMTLLVKKADVTAINNSDGVSVALTIGDASGEQTINAVIDRLTYNYTKGDNPPIGFNIEKLVIDFSRQDEHDSINLKADFSLPEDAAFDPETDVVTFEIDGISFEIPAGSFKGNKKEFKYTYDSPKGVEPRVIATLNFKNGELTLVVKKADVDVINNADGVCVTFAIGSIVSNQTINMNIDALTYPKQR